MLTNLNGFDCLREVATSTIRKIITIDTSQYNIFHTAKNTEKASCYKFYEHLVFFQMKLGQVQIWKLKPCT